MMPSLVTIIKLPLRPFVRLFFRWRRWISRRLPQVAWTLFWQPRGKSWVDYYSTRLDKFALSGLEKHRYRTEHFRNYVSRGEEQVELLKKYGLLPTHRFLDYGCGFLRLAYFMIDYLTPNNRYVGVEISKHRVETGKRFLLENGYKDDQFITILVSDCSLNELSSFQFDFVWADSVLTHMPQEDIVEMLLSLKPLLSETAQFLFTFIHMERTKVIGKDYYYSFDAMEQICKEAGYHYELLDAAWPTDNSAVARICLPV